MQNDGVCIETESMLVNERNMIDKYNECICFKYISSIHLAMNSHIYIYIGISYTNQDHPTTRLAIHFNYDIRYVEIVQEW